MVAYLPAPDEVAAAESVGLACCDEPCAAAASPFAAFLRPDGCMPRSECAGVMNDAVSETIDRTKLKLCGCTSSRTREMFEPGMIAIERT